MRGRCACMSGHLPGTRIEKTQEDFAKVEAAIRKIVGNYQIDVILDNIGLPYSGINIALSDSATVGPMDGEILISLKRKHSPTAALMAKLRRELPKRFPQMQFFFQPADIVDQVLNFGQPSPIDIRVSGPNDKEAYDWPQNWRVICGSCREWWIRMSFRSLMRPRSLLTSTGRLPPNSGSISRI